jgi:hypothetical protein
MKLFHFGYISYGESYSVVAENEEQALAFIKAHLQKEIDKEIAKGEDGHPEFPKMDLEAISKYKESGAFVVETFALGEVMETERA